MSPISAIVKIAILGEAASAVKAFKSTETAATNMQSKMGKVNKAVDGLKLPAAAVFGGISAGLFKAGSDAAELSDTLDASKVILGSAASAVAAFGDTAAVKFGISKESAITAADAMAVIGSKAGLSGVALGKFSTDLVSRAGDVASLLGGPATDAVAAFQSALQGEFEPARKFGVLLDQATLQTAALKMGIISNVKTALTPSQKALVVQSEILRQTSKAQGDFGRTAGSAKNQQQTLHATLSNLSATLGKSLLPIMASVAGTFTSWAGAIAAHQTTFKIAVAVFGALAGALLLVAGALKVWSVIQAVLDLELSLSPIGLIVIGVAALVAIIVIIATKTQIFQTIWRTSWGAIKAVFSGTFTFIRDHWKLLLAILTGPIGLAVLVISKHWTTIKNGATGVFTWVTGKFNAIVTFFTGLPARISKAASGMWNGLKEAFRDSVNFIIRGWNSLDFAMPSVDTHIPGVGTIGGWTLGLPDIPLLAGGGVIRTGGLAMLHAAEVVTPGHAVGNVYNTNNFYISPLSDPLATARAIEKVMAARERTSGRRRLLPGV